MQRRCLLTGAPAILALLVMALAGALASDVAEAPIPDLGVLSPVQVTVQVTVPKGGLWRSPQSSFVLTDTVSMVTERGQALQRCEGEPQRGQFRCRLDGAIRFAVEDSGQRVQVNYQYRPRRIAMLPAVADTGYRDAVPILREALAEELTKRGFVVVPADDVADALAAAGGATTSASAALLPTQWASLARQLDAAYLLAPTVAADQSSALGGFYGHTYRSPSGTSETHSMGRVDVRMMEAAVGVTVLDGATGELAAQHARSESHRVRLRHFAAARRDLIRDLAGQVVVAWREPSL